MFDEKTALVAWRSKLAETGTLFEADLDELESHLRDHLDGLAEVGITGEEAFAVASARLGETRALDEEFAKVNPLLAWRAALFWISAGVMMVLGLRPLQELATLGVIAITMSLHFGNVLATIAMWSVAFVSPLAFFGVIFPLVRRRLAAPLWCGRTPTLRIGVIVACAVLMLATHLISDWGWFSFHAQRRWGLGLTYVHRATDHASYALAVVAPIFLGVIAVRQRRLVLRDRAGAAPLFWLAIGLFIGSVRSELHVFVRFAAFATGGALHLGADSMTRLMWVVTLGCPLVLFASTFAYLRHRAPGPDGFVRARGALVAMAFSGAIAIAAVFVTGALGTRVWSTLSGDAISAGVFSWLVAGIVTSCVLPVAVGTLMLRLRNAASLAR